MNRKQNCLSYWFPRLQASGVAVPKTVIVRARHDLLRLYCNATDGEPELTKTYTVAHERFVLRLVCATSLVGLPCFLRTGMGSGKHDWVHTCCVHNVDKIRSHIFALIEWSCMVDPIGLPTDVWVVREFLKTEPAFHAFAGMPITKERRWFFRDGQILGHHPYWPPDSIEFWRKGDHPGNWRKRLDAIQVESEEEIAYLGKLTLRVARKFKGGWSLDWLWTTDREWVAIDMARAEHSFCWNEHPNAPKNLGSR